MPGKSLIPNPYPFKRLISKLKFFDIVFEKGRGKGSHGCFIGKDPQGKSRTFPVPQTQQKEMNSDYFKSLRHLFGLTNKDLDVYFANPKSKSP